MYLQDWDRKLAATDRKILLYIDNCSSHSITVELQNIAVEYLPPNTTAKSQVSKA